VLHTQWNSSIIYIWHIKPFYDVFILFKIFIISGDGQSFVVDKEKIEKMNNDTS
jgi:hypothetical protein